MIELVRDEMSDVGIYQATLEGRIEEALQYPGCWAGKQLSSY